MITLTLKVLASLVQMHGSNATIVSDNQGVDALLGNVREQIQGAGEITDQPGKITEFDTDTGMTQLAAINSPYSKSYGKYIKWIKYTKTNYEKAGIAQ